MLPRLEVDFPSLDRYRAGNTGVDYVHRFDSGKPGPTVMVNALTHGNEVCGVTPAIRLLNNPPALLRGTLYVGFANVEAYQSFDPQRPYASRMLVHNLNRIWSSQWLDGSEDSPELRRARQMRPIIDQVDYLLDIHSTRSDFQPFWVYRGLDRNAALATRIGLPAAHLVMPVGMGSGVPLVEYGPFGQADAEACGLVVECGGHFFAETSRFADDVTQRFLTVLGMIAPTADSGSATAGASPAAAPVARRYELIETIVVKTAGFAFARPVQGLDRFDRGELIATDGDREIRSPCDGCVLFMPTPEPVVGREGVYLARPV